MLQSPTPAETSHAASTASTNVLVESRLKNEISHGKYLAEFGAGEIWNWESPAGRRRWSRRVKMLTGDLNSNMKVLELGCGTGYFTEHLAQTNAAITAIDISPDLLRIAEQQVQHTNVTFALENAYQMTFPDASFDAVIGSSVLHHLNVNQALNEIFRVLKPGGFIRFTEPNMLNPQIAIQKNIPFIKKWLGDSPDETAFFRWPLTSKLRGQKFKDIQIDCFDFLHPKIPSSAISFFEVFVQKLEAIPLVKEIAGSLFIRASKQ